MIIYIDAFNGISGDMILSAFFDIGFSYDYFIDNLNKLNILEEASIKVEKFFSYGLNGKRLIIKNNSRKKRNYCDLLKIIEKSDINEEVKKNSIKILNKIAEAEAKVHNVNIEDVHFHEIGAIDTIIDIVGFSLAVHFFKIKEFYVSTVPVGTGEIKIDHGIFPNPSPASIELLKGFEIKILNEPFEFSTPTGCAILSAFKFKQKNGLNFIPEKIGYGFGFKEFPEKPNCLRIFVGKKILKDYVNSKIFEIKFNIDDMTGEEIGYFFQKCKDYKEIVDVSIISRITKKNRPGYIFEILVNDLNEKVLKFIFQYTTTSGIRIEEKNRIILDRYFEDKKKVFKSKKIGIKKWKLEFDKIDEE